MPIFALRHRDGLKECMDHENDEVIRGGLTTGAASAWLLEEDSV